MVRNTSSPETVAQLMNLLTDKREANNRQVIYQANTASSGSGFFTVRANFQLFSVSFVSYFKLNTNDYFCFQSEDITLCLG